jgi:hypothetical protein
LPYAACRASGSDPARRRDDIGHLRALGIVADIDLRQAIARRRAASAWPDAGRIGCGQIVVGLQRLIDQRIQIGIAEALPPLLGTLAPWVKCWGSPRGRIDGSIALPAPVGASDTGVSALGPSEVQAATAIRGIRRQTFHHAPSSCASMEWCGSPP